MVGSCALLYTLKMNVMKEGIKSSVALAVLIAISVWLLCQYSIPG